MRSTWDGARLAVSWLTVLPVRGPSDVSRSTAAAAIRWAVLPGLLLGSLAAALQVVLGRLGAPPLVTGLLVVAVLALGTRGMHVDGLADTADGLGCYGPPERALTVMRDGGAGPFAVATLIVVVGLQTATIAWLATGPAGWPVVVLAVIAGRCTFVWCCRRGVPAARPEGLGSLVADSQPPLVGAAYWLVLAALAIPVVPGRPWQGPLAVLLSAVLVAGLSWHTARRFGGLTGDVLGAMNELATTVVLVVASCGSQWVALGGSVS
ncbi:MAG TPA: adenosylcobinamide-GDP ribazoletransferase [Pseudonocardia sp.]|jgi:adenosylcobinamide-GDP ribazoletransferase|nr:adenosylcobinamide-GDP ribazoletransferase [Pseudonocardia sp.]